MTTYRPKRSLTVSIPEEVARQLDELAEDAIRRTRDQASVLLVEAVTRAIRERAPASIPTAIDPEGPR